MATDGERADDDLPPVLGAFVGRAGEAAEIVSLLTTARLFTLTGTGGCGKTRLAAHVAFQTRDTFRQGVRWVDLSALADPALVPNVVAARCGVAEHGGLEALEALMAALRPQQLLLVLDNCEHLLPACARLCETVLGACPELHILTTSREALAIPGEVIWLVPPLRVPEQYDCSSVERARAFEAIELFVARAVEALPAFRLTQENVAPVARICRRVAGLPLAIELAAARLRTMSLVELAERLDDAGHILTRGRRTAQPRQQTLRATLDWSYGLLSAVERVVFERLAVFAGSFSLEAAEAVCAGADVAVADVPDLLARLVEKSLVIVQDRQTNTRYRLLEPLRQYAWDRLVATGTTAQVQRRHRDWFAALAAQVVELVRQDQGRWLEEMEVEHDNFRAALDWSLTDGDVTSAGQLVEGLWQFWLLKGYFAEGHRRLEQLLTIQPDRTSLRAQLLWVAGLLARPDIAQGRHHFNESVVLWRALGNRNREAQALSSLGFLEQECGNHERAASYLEQSLALVRAASESLVLARVLTGLALSVLAAGDIDRALALCLEGLTLHQRMGDVRGAAAATANLGLIWQAHGDEQRAVALWNESLAERRRIGDRGGMAHVLSLLGSQAAGQATYTRATGFYHESLVIRQQMGDRQSIAAIFDGLAAVSLALNDLGRAVHLAGAADALRTSVGMSLPAREQAIQNQTLAILRARLGAAAFARAWTEGSALALDQAIAVALALPASADLDAHEMTPTELPVQQTTPLPAHTDDLTRREREVLRLLTFGLTYAQIADALTISPRTADAHIRAIFGKLGVRSRTAATRIALQFRLV